MSSSTTVQPAALHWFDAIHLASALTIADELDAFVTYDTRLADGANSRTERNRSDLSDFPG